MMISSIVLILGFNGLNFFLSTELAEFIKELLYLANLYFSGTIKNFLAFEMRLIFSNWFNHFFSSSPSFLNE